MKHNKLLALLMFRLFGGGDDDYAFKNVPRYIDIGANYGNPIFTPQHKKYKGWQKEAKRCSFNKNR